MRNFIIRLKRYLSISSPTFTFTFIKDIKLSFNTFKLNIYSFIMSNVSSYNINMIRNSIILFLLAFMLAEISLIFLLDMLSPIYCMDQSAAESVNSHSEYAENVPVVAEQTANVLAMEELPTDVPAMVEQPANESEDDRNSD